MGRSTLRFDATFGTDGTVIISFDIAQKAADRLDVPGRGTALPASDRPTPARGF